MGLPRFTKWRHCGIIELMLASTRLLPFCLTFACATVSDEPVHHRQSTASVRMMRISRAVTLEVLDWGGRGPSLVFLAGLGSTAHIFDDFAPQFTDSFHVVGITRRGFGASAGSPPPSDLDTLVADIKAVLDSLQLRRVVLVGHSIAGEEMTRFAEIYDSVCAGLVYLDAAYDRSGIDTLSHAQPSAPGPRIRESDTTSFDSIRNVYARVMGVRVPESEILATNRFDTAGRYHGQLTADSLTARVVGGHRVARYDQAHCNALAIYAVPDSVADVIPYYRELDAGDRARGEALLRFVQGVVADSRSHVARFPQNTIVDIHGGNHFIFLQRPREVARAMRAFLSTNQPTPVGYTARGQDLLMVLRRPDFTCSDTTAGRFLLTFKRYTFDGQRWELRQRQARGCYESDEPLPAASAFP